MRIFASSKTSLVSISKTYYIKRRLGRNCVRIWLYGVATNFNIISQEYDNKKDGIFLDFLFLTFNDFLV